MKRKILLILLSLFLSSTAAGLEVSVGDSCGSSEPLVSLNDTEGGHIAEPDYYPNKVCVDGAETLNISLSCKKDQETLFTMDNITNSHLSIFENQYNYNMCSENLNAQIRESCTNGTKALSVTGDENTHASSPSYTEDPYNQSLCLTGMTVENVTLEMEGVSGDIYADGETINSGQFLYPPLEFPYIVNEEPLGIVSYGRTLKLSRPFSDTVSITQEADSANFLLPFTSGGYEKVERQQNLIMDREFMQITSPGFRYDVSGDPLIRLVYTPRVDVEGFEDRIVNYNSKLRVRNLGLENEELIVEIKPDQKD